MAPLLALAHLPSPPLLLGPWLMCMSYSSCWPFCLSRSRLSVPKLSLVLQEWADAAPPASMEEALSRTLRRTLLEMLMPCADPQAAWQKLGASLAPAQYAEEFQRQEELWNKAPPPEEQEGEQEAACGVPEPVSTSLLLEAMSPSPLRTKAAAAAAAAPSAAAASTRAAAPAAAAAPATAPTPLAPPAAAAMDGRNLMESLDAAAASEGSTPPQLAAPSQELKAARARIAQLEQQLQVARSLMAASPLAAQAARSAAPALLPAAPGTLPARAAGVVSPLLLHLAPGGLPAQATAAPALLPAAPGTLPAELHRRTQPDYFAACRDIGLISPDSSMVHGQARLSNLLFGTARPMVFGSAETAAGMRALSVPGGNPAVAAAAAAAAPVARACPAALAAPAPALLSAATAPPAAPSRGQAPRINGKRAVPALSSITDLPTLLSWWKQPAVAGDNRSRWELEKAGESGWRKEVAEDGTRKVRHVIRTI